MIGSVELSILNAKTDVNYRHLHLRGAVGFSRTEVFDGRTYTVVPVVALMEGVIFAVNADVPEFVPLKTLMMAPQGWNGRPVVLDHPSLNGRMISANTPGVLERKAFGVVFNTRVAGSKLLMEAWLDPVKAATIGESCTDTVMRAAQGTPVEVSVGVYATVEDAKGTYNGKNYKATWVDMIPDHLALLSAGEIGACSNAMGCGVRTHLVTAKGMECPVIDEECPAKVARRSLRQHVKELITADAAPVAPVEGSPEEEATESPDQEIIEDAHLNSFPRNLFPYSVHQRGVKKPRSFHKTQSEAAAVAAANAKVKRIPHVVVNRATGKVVERALRAAGGPGSGRYPVGNHLNAAEAHRQAMGAHERADAAKRSGNDNYPALATEARVASTNAEHDSITTRNFKTGGLAERALTASLDHDHSLAVDLHERAAKYHDALSVKSVKTLGDNPGHDFHGNQYTAAQQESATKITELQGHIRRISDTVSGNTGAAIRKRLALTKSLRDELEKHENIVEPTRHQAIVASAKLTPVKNAGGGVTGYDVHHEGQHIGTIKPTTFQDFKMVNGAPQMRRGHGYNAHAADGSLIMQNLKKGEAVEYLAKAHSRKLRGLSHRQVLREQVHELIHESASA